MRSPSDLLNLWSALAAVVGRPGRLRILAGGSGNAAGHWLHPVPTVVVALRAPVRVESPGGAAVDLAAGDCLVIPAGASHRHVPLRSGAATLELGFDYGACDLEFHLGGDTIGATLPRQPAETLVARLLERDAAAFGDLLGLVFARPLQDVRPLPAAALRMRDFIRSHGLTRPRGAPITAADIARAGRLQPSRAWQVFREHFGCTPRQALERRRCAVAAALLEQGTTVAEAAARCGFSDRGTFTRAFRRIHGRTPRGAP